jgi:arylesterase/paraoxonase
VWKRIAWIGLVLVVAVFGFALDSMRRGGEFTTLTPRPLDCRAVPGVIGPEDITIDRARKVAYISATDIRAVMANRPGVGAIYRYALGDAAPTVVYTRTDGSFHPHGISLLSDRRGPDLLYVVNHPTNELHTIEVFEVDANGARQVQTFRDPLLVSPNDVVAISRDELYVANDHAIGRGPGQLWDDALRRERAQIVHIRSGVSRVVVSDLAYANGINATPDGSVVYVAESTGRRMRVYKRTASTGDLALQRTIDVGLGPDNIEIAANGSLYIAGHPKLITFLRHAANAKVLSPSEVVRVANGKVERIYLDLGSEISGSSVAAPFDDHVLIGAVFADHFLDCKLP